jgi:CheY-like chemotaxis protein
LSQVLGFAKQSGGGMRIETRVGEGTSAKLYLPRAAENTIFEGSPFAATFTESKRTSAVILLVDDDSAVREVTASILEDIGYVVLKVGSGGAALDLINQNTKIDLVLLDLAMPGMSGVEVASHVRRKFPTLPILFLTGYADQTALSEVGEQSIIRKPFIDNELITKVDATLMKGGMRLSDKVVVPLRRRGS